MKLSVSHPSHSPWKSPKSGDSGVEHEADAPAADSVSRWWWRCADPQGSWPHLEQPAYSWHPRVCDRTGSVALCRFRPEPGGGGSVRERWSQGLARDAAQVDGRG